MRYESWRWILENKSEQFTEGRKKKFVFSPGRTIMSNKLQAGFFEEDM